MSKKRTLPNKAIFMGALGLFLAGLFYCPGEARAQGSAPEQRELQAEKADDGFVALTPENRPFVSGKSLMIGAYIAILGLFLLYVLWLLKQERALKREAARLNHLTLNSKNQT